MNRKVLSLSCSYHEPKNNGMKFGVPGILFYILSCSCFFNPTFHVEAINSNHLSLSLLRVTLVHHIPVTVAVLPPRNCSPTFSPWFASLSVLAPRPIFVPSINQLMVLGSKSSLLEIGSDFLGFAQLNS